jgi:hypothetical protein
MSNATKRGLAAAFTFGLLYSGALMAAQDRLTDQSQHELPTHKSWGQFHDTMDVIVDEQNHNVCYVARQSDSHSMSMFCLPQHN